MTDIKFSPGDERAWELMYQKHLLLTGYFVLFAVRERANSKGRCIGYIASRNRIRHLWWNYQTGVVLTEKVMRKAISCLIAEEDVYVGWLKLFRRAKRTSWKAENLRWSIWSRRYYCLLIEMTKSTHKQIGCKMHYDFQITSVTATTIFGFRQFVNFARGQTWIRAHQNVCRKMPFISYTSKMVQNIIWFERSLPGHWRLTFSRVCSWLVQHHVTIWARNAELFIYLLKMSLKKAAPFDERLHGEQSSTTNISQKWYIFRKSWI